jgi:hypothetical protein
MTDLAYSHWTYQDSFCHLLTIDLTQYELRPVMDKQEFPFNSGHPQTKAIEEGAVACGPGGFNVVLYHGFGIQDQPQHVLVVDQEIWTTGIGAGGYGVLVTPEGVLIQKNHVQVHVWKPDGGVIEVEHVNRGHEGEVVAFTPRGGTNEFPRYRGKHFYSLTEPAVPTEPVRMSVGKVGDTPPRVWRGQTVLESTYDLGLVLGDWVTWKQNLGADDVTHVMSGWPQIVRDGENIVHEYEMDPTASHGPDNWFIRRNPRTAIGCSEDGMTAYMLFVEGRLPNSYRPDAPKSKGLRLKALAETAVKHGIYQLVVMDGGGSAFQFSEITGVIPGCYNASGTIEGQRPAHFSASVF